MHESPIPFFQPDIDERCIEAVGDTLRSGWLTSGPRTREFEEAFAHHVGARHAVAVNSCTAALHLALAALGIGPDDEVIVPTMTFAATAEVVIHLGARPVLVDCESRTLNVDPGAIAAAITSKTRAIVPVHFGGHPAAMDRIEEIAAGSGIPIVEDAAHAFPAQYKGRVIGTIGDVTAFSFYANKTITTGEGGIATTDDPDLADRMRTLSLHGLNNDTWDRFSTRSSWDYDIVTPGYKYNLTDIAATIGISQLERADDFRATRKHQAARYTDHFADVDGIQPLLTHDDVQHSYHLYVVVLDIDRLSVTRNEVIDILKRHGIGTSVHYRPLHLHTLYRNDYEYAPEDLPIATHAFPRILSLPTYPSLSDREIDRVASTLSETITTHLQR